MTIYARVSPETIKLIETYYYEKYIDSNESLEEKEAPKGKIEVIIPYDGHKHFTSKAIQDVAQQIKNSSLNGEVKALIGHLAISNYDNTDLENLLSQNQSVPLLIPVNNNTLSKIKHLGEDQHLCIIKYNYKPITPEFQPIYLEIQVLDDYNYLSVWSSQEDKTLWNFLKTRKIELPKDKNFVNEVAEIIAEQVKSGFGVQDDSLKGKLFIQIQVRLALPVEFKLLKFPRLKRLSIQWPTLTSFRNFDLKKIDDQNTSTKNIVSNPLNIIYNPLNKSLEWISRSSDVSITELNQANSESSNAQWQNYEIKMLVGIIQPGELYQEANLQGEIEIEIPELLLSELQARFYGFNNIKVGEYKKEAIEFKSRIITNFNLNINEAFKKRIRSTAQEFIFDNVLPTEENLRIIKNVLKSQGFSSDSITLTQSRSQTSNDSNKQTTIIKKKWLIYAERSEGIDTMTLWIIIPGEEKTTLVTIVQGTRKFQQEETTGKLTMYLLGKLPRHSHILIQRMNALQQELRKQLARVQQGPATRL
ncbi:MAG: hypothetical protein V7K90_24570 [Nostoc sp.]|uniref:hypothetical protein n=1 Tax=Nostoc sp. TaxID=1180 RepID=UPI002FFA2337